MRISINVRKIAGPYGGGRNFADNLENYLAGNGHEVFRDLPPQLDLILLVSSKPNRDTTAYTPEEAFRYKNTWRNTILVQRINSCDEARAQNSGINQAYLAVNAMSDYTIFVSEFIRDFYRSVGLPADKPGEVILTGADRNVFSSNGASVWQPGQKMKVITHHFSNNVMKGYDIYDRLDKMLATQPFSELFEFTIAGNIPPGYNFSHSQVIGPIELPPMAGLLRESHLYLTGARYEAGGNHYVEAMRCGLPVLYLESGSSGEYCAPFGGLAYDVVNFPDKLLEMRDSYPRRREKALECPFADDWMCEQYESTFKRLIAQQQEQPARQPGLIRQLAYNLGTDFQSKTTQAKRAIWNMLH